ncbi:MAG TPA: AI-2E family transporter [Usitatibacter sp.]
MASSRFEQYARIAAIALLVIGCFLVLQPFLGAILFAGILCFSTWPIFVALRDRLGGRAWLAAVLIVLVLVIAIVVPVALAAQSIIVHSSAMVELFRGFLDRKSSFELPQFVRDLPALGPWLETYVRALTEGSAELADLAKRFTEPAKGFLLAMGRAIGEGLVQLLIALFVAFFFYRDGERVRRLLIEGMERIAGPEHGGALIATAQSAVKGVIYGLIGTAIAQAAVAFVGFLIAGVPGALLLAAVTFVLSLVPMGPVLVWGGAAAWLYFHGEVGWSIFMVVYGVAVISSVDNVAKPILMSRAGNLSLLVVVLGVFGGAIAFGFIGLFVGPALLAVGWNLMKKWLEFSPDSASPVPSKK